MKYYKVTIWRSNDASTMKSEEFEELGQAMVRVHSKGGELLFKNDEPQDYRWRIDNENPFTQEGEFEVALGRYDNIGNVLIHTMRTK